jgi:hypothetical protein
LRREIGGRRTIAVYPVTWADEMAAQKPNEHITGLVADFHAAFGNVSTASARC